MRGVVASIVLAGLGIGFAAFADQPSLAHNSFWYHQRRDDLSGFATDGIVRPSLFTGAGEMAIPLEVPRGTGGVQPNLALRYSSRTGRANAGVGWSIDLPRIVKSMKYGSDRAQQSSVEVFEFMGEELVKHGPQESGCDRYYSSVERFQKILFCPLTNHWLVFDKDGTESKYGSTPFSRYTNTTLGVTFEWNLDQVTDTHGLSWKATYLDVGTEQRRLDKISYTYRNGVEVGEVREVRFTWEERYDDVVHYRYGQKASLSKRIKEVVVWLGSQRVRKYALTYSSSTHLDTGNSKLISVQVFGTTDAISLPATTFGYQAMLDDPGFESTPLTFTSTAALQQDSAGITSKDLFDINGDGLPDAVDATTSASNYWSVRLGTGTGFQGTAQNWTGTGNNKIRHYSSATWPAVPSLLKDVVDFNADGLTDFLTSDSTTITFFKNNGNATFTSQALPDNGQPGYLEKYHNRQTEQFSTKYYAVTLGTSDLVDINGDGCPDMVSVAVTGQWNYYRNRLCEATPVPAFASAVALTWQGGAAPSYVSQAGSTLYYLSKVRMQTTSNYQAPNSTNGVSFKLAGFADFNGDGLQDFYDSIAGLFFGTGSGFVHEDGDTSYQSSLAQMPVPTGHDGRFDKPMAQTHENGFYAGLVDMNADGRVDLVVSNANLASPNLVCEAAPVPPMVSAYEWAVYPNHGNGFFNSLPQGWPAQRGSPNSGLGWIQAGKYCWTTMKTRSIDFDASGTIDFVTNNGSSWEVFCSELDRGSDGRR